MLAKHRRKFVILLVLLALPVVLHVAIGRAARLEMPPVQPASFKLLQNGAIRRFGASYVLDRGKLLEVHLTGSPESIGHAHARLLYPEMVENEGILLSHFRQQVPNAFLRGLLLDLAQFRYHSVDRGMSSDRLREIAAGSLGFQPDPFSDVFPTYQRFVYLNALYDMSLSFEHSPLIGCTSFAFAGSAVRGGGALLARAFDFEVDEVFDRGKAVFFVREEGQIPFASVAWPGLVGVVSGMNAAGVAVVVHGARAGVAQTQGEPVAHALRRVLSKAKTSRDAARLLSERSAMVSHIVVVADGRGENLVIERTPLQADHVRSLPARAAVTNHLEGPGAEDEKNVRVRASTSTLARRARADELVKASYSPVDAEAAVNMLRDRSGAGGKSLELGDRAAIDALIATHGVVMHTQTRTLWVSESPHLLGRFVAFDLARLLSDNYVPELELTLPGIAADSLLTSGRYERFRAQTSTPETSDQL